MTFKRARDPKGEFVADWSLLQDAPTVPSRVEFIPFAQGDARLMSLPCAEMMLTAIGAESEGLTHAVVAMRVGSQSIHQAMDAAGLRMLAESAGRLAGMLEGRRDA